MKMNVLLPEDGFAPNIHYQLKGRGAAAHRRITKKMWG